jgi:uncharacterized membrane protein
MTWLLEGALWLVWEFLINFVIYNTGVLLLRIVSVGYWDYELNPMGVTDFDTGRGALWPYLVGGLFYGLIIFGLFS